MDTLRQAADWFRDRFDKGVAVLASVDDGRPIMVVAVTPSLTTKGVDAGKMIRPMAGKMGGGGGGRPGLAQAGGKQASKVQDALDMAPILVKDALATN